MPHPSPAYRFYPNDILNDVQVAALSAEEECWYRRALDLSWLNDGMPSNPERLARVIGKGCTIKGAIAVLAFFPLRDDKEGLARNPRLEEERIKQTAWRAGLAKGGRNAAASRQQQRKKKRKQPPQQQEAQAQAKATEKPQPPQVPQPPPTAAVKGSNGTKARTDKKKIVEPPRLYTSDGQHSYPLREYFEAFPNAIITEQGVDALLKTIAPDSIGHKAWEMVLLKVKGNGNDPTKIGTLCEIYADKVAYIKQQVMKKQSSVRSATTTLYVGKDWTTAPPPSYACNRCQDTGIWEQNPFTTDPARREPTPCDCGQYREQAG